MHIDTKTIFVAGGLVVLIILGLIVFAPNAAPTETDEQVEMVDTPEDDASNEDADASNESDSESSTPAPTSTGAPVGTSEITSPSVTIAPEPEEPKNSVLLAENDSTNLLKIELATLNRSGYVVIYRVNNRGKSSLVGRTKLLKTGTYTDLTVQVDKLIVDSEMAVAVLHEDDGDGKFEYPESDDYILEDGIIVSDIDFIEIPKHREPKNLERSIEDYINESSSS